MRLNRQEDIEIAARATARTCIALTGQPNTGPIINARWNTNLKGALAAHLAVAVAGLTWIGDHAARSITAWAGPLDGKEALGRPHTSRAAAGRTGGRAGPSLRPGA